MLVLDSLRLSVAMVYVAVASTDDTTIAESIQKQDSHSKLRSVIASLYARCTCTIRHPRTTYVSVFS